jgi:two-component system nitrate/nitrite sensor histidine kinase NarX
VIQHFHGRTGVEVELSNKVRDINLTPDQEVQVFHIVQEALANIGKHSHAMHVRVSIESEANRYAVTIEDNGIGLTSKQSTGPGMHLGMNIMRERAQRLGGDILFENRVGEGMRVRLEFPATAYRKVSTS